MVVHSEIISKDLCIYVYGSLFHKNMFLIDKLFINNYIMDLTDFLIK